ncbi:unnamed protein product [Symbiodinium sp. CCMP2456]|nr:unnamed protein product [Symbiodinium sp. CCMP2456]
MVSSGCVAATASYTLPILACCSWSLLSLLNAELPSLQRLQRFFEYGTQHGEPAPPDGGTPEEAKRKHGQWPVMSVDFAKPSIGLCLWCCFPILGYAVVRALSGCPQYTWYCWQVEDQTTSSHLRNVLHLLTASILLAWLCSVPPSAARYRALFVSVAFCEFLINKAIWDSCEDFMAHSVSVGSTFGAFDVFVALTTVLTLVIHTCEGLPSLRRCFQKFCETMGRPTATNPELYMTASGQRNYLLYMSLLTVFHVGLFLAFADDVHAHHYWMGFVVASCCIFPTPLSRLMLLKSVMMAIDGIGVWGADAIVGEDEGGMSESDADLRLILCVLVVLALAVAVGVNLYRDPCTRSSRRQQTATE